VAYNAYASTVRATSHQNGSWCSMCVSTIVGNACNSWNTGGFVFGSRGRRCNDSNEEVGVDNDVDARFPPAVAVIAMVGENGVTSGIRGPSAYTPDPDVEGGIIPVNVLKDSPLVVVIQRLVVPIILQPVVVAVVCHLCRR
jgi:hypothetical protein